jgi:hypothetical protein
MTLPPQEASHPDFGLSATAVSLYIDLLILVFPPQVFNMDIVVAPLFPCPADHELLALLPCHDLS